MSGMSIKAHKDDILDALNTPGVKVLYVSYAARTRIKAARALENAGKVTIVQPHGYADLQVTKVLS